jgi:ATP-dependent helicase/nuclease subunit A
MSDRRPRAARAVTGKSRLPDQEARDLIERELDLTLLVEAGAGSGKTESLARRMAAGIAAGRYEIEGIAAVTFTRKAAAELRARFQLELERRLREETDALRHAWIETALSHLERLFAGTIHAFCAHLIRERPVEAGVAPGFTEQEEAEDAEFRQRAWRDYLDRERATGSPVLRELQDAGMTARDLDQAFATVSMFSDVAFPPGEAKAPEPKPAWHALEAFWGKLEPLLPPIESKTTCKVQRAARTFRGRWRVADRRRAAVLAELLELWTKPKVTQNCWPGTTAQRKATRDQVERLIDDFHAATVAPFLEAWRHYRYRLAITLLLGGREFAQTARRHALTLNYGDLLAVAARLLREDRTVRAALQAKYRWLFVDEFQDTNALQAEVIVLLASEADAGQDWTRARLRPGALFVVGDPKQSIYRFTGVDIETYGRMRSIVERSNGKVVELTASFRALPSLCQWANRMFGGPGFFPAAPTPQQPAFHPLDVVRPAGNAASSGLRTLTIPASVEARDVAGADADAIASVIRHAVDRGERRWGDFLILTRKRAGLPRYTAALDRLHIPLTVSGAVAFSQSREVGILAGLLGALADPDDGVVLVGVLRGPLFGLSDEALFRHREAGFGFHLNAPIPEDATGPVVEALRQVHEMYRWTRKLPAPAAVERILQTTGILARATATTPGAAEAGDLLHAVDRVRQITEAGGSLAAAAAVLAKDLEGSEVESVPLEPGRQDVVRAMNLHKAKGLEAPVVFLADPLGGVKARADIRVVREGSQARGYFQITRKNAGWGETLLAEPEGWDAHEAAELDYVRAEETRLLYVASTRARDLLVVSRWAGSQSKQRPWTPFDTHLGAARELTLPPALALQPRPLGDLGAPAREAAAATRQARHETAAAPSWRVESVTATTHKSGPVGRPLQAGRTREPDTGMAWGTLVHGLLEHAMRGPHRDRTHLERVASWLTFGNAELKRVVPEALQTVERVMASEFWQQAMAAEERQVEVPFAVTVAGSTPPTVLYGVVDLAYRTPDGWHLIDYKTDQAEMAALRERYAGQLRQYSTQWSALTDQPIGHVAIYRIRGDELSPDLRAERPTLQQ